MKYSGHAFLVLIIFGFIFRLFITWNGHFIFNMDNARDFVDVREMMVLGKMRLIGPTSAIEGVFTGPFWYYILGIVFFISGGNPYSAIILEIVLWAVGGFFIYKLCRDWGMLSLLCVGAIWVTSNYIILQTQYAFHPNLITLLTPLFIFLGYEYLREERPVFFILLCALGGLFFNFEMNFGMFIPFMILAGVFFSKKYYLLKTPVFWLGALIYLLFLLPQIIFDFKHQFIMSKSMMIYLSSDKLIDQWTMPFSRLGIMIEKYYDILRPTFFNSSVVVNIFIGVLAVCLFRLIFKKNDLRFTVIFGFTLIPFVGYLFLPVEVNSWHLGGVAAASIIMVGYLLNFVSSQGNLGKFFGVVILVFMARLSYVNIENYIKEAYQKSSDPSMFVNEIAAVGNVYKQAGGENFRVYIYLPSVIDYPYQYLFWWYGQSKYGYLPQDYSYLPNKPTYIRNKEMLSNKISPKDSGVTFLIKEPDDPMRRELWENNFKHLKLISENQVGPLEIEARKKMDD